MFQKQSIAAVAAAGILALGASGAGKAAPIEKTADGYPKRTITVVVPFGPGGGSDQVARAWAQGMEEVTGTNVKVVNQPGGGGIAGTVGYMNRPKDGYTLLEQTDTIVTAEAAGQIDFTLGKELKLVCITQATFSQIYAQPNESRFSDWKSFLAYAKKNPDKLTIANIGIAGAMEVMQMVALEKAAGFKLRQVSYDKPAQRYAALIGGQNDLLFEQPGDVRKFLEAEKMKPLLTILKEAPSAFKDTPSLADAGLADVPVLQRVRMFWVHGDVSEARRQYLGKACKAAFDTKGYQAFNRRKYMHLARSYYDTEEGTKLVRDMVEAYKKLYKEAGLIK